MIDPTEFEPLDVYDKVSEYLKKKRETQARQAASFRPPAFAPPPSSASYIASIQQQQEEQKPALTRALELLGRPEAGFRGAVTGPARGLSPLAGFQQGLTQPETVPGYSETFGVPQPVEAAMSFALDPLNLVPFGRLAGGASTALKTVGAAGGLTRAARGAAPAISTMGNLPRGGIEPATEIVRESALPRLLRAIPGMERAAEIISPRLIHKGGSLESIMDAREGSLESAQQFASTLLARVTGGQQLVSKVDKDGRLVLTNGEARAAGDIFQNPEHYRLRLPESDYNIIKRFGELFDEAGPVRSQMKALQDRIRTEIDGGEELAKRFDLPPVKGIEKEEQFFPRYALRQA